MFKPPYQGEARAEYSNYFCSVLSCKRHRKGFPRRYNLLQHMKLCHPDQSSSLLRAHQEGSFAKSVNESLEADFVVGGKSSEGGEDRLRNNLKELKELRDEIIGDIEILEGAVGITGADGW